jgi:hypothetical protein
LPGIAAPLALASQTTFRFTLQTCSRSATAEQMHSVNRASVRTPRRSAQALIELPSACPFAALQAMACSSALPTPK